MISASNCQRVFLSQKSQPKLKRGRYVFRIQLRSNTGYFGELSESDGDQTYRRSPVLYVFQLTVPASRAPNYQMKFGLPIVLALRPIEKRICHKRVTYIACHEFVTFFRSSRNGKGYPFKVICGLVSDKFNGI